MVYGARLESVLGSRPHEFESRILRQRRFRGQARSLVFNQNSLVATIPTKFLFYKRQTLQPFKGLSCYAVAGGINANILFPIETLLITALTWDQHGNEASSFNPNRAKMPAQADKKKTVKHENKVYGYI